MRLEMEVIWPKNGILSFNLQFKEDILVGANSVGYHKHLGMLRGLIETKIPLGPWKDRLIANPVQIADAYLGANEASLKSS